MTHPKTSLIYRVARNKFGIFHTQLFHLSPYYFDIILFIFLLFSNSSFTDQIHTITCLFPNFRLDTPDGGGPPGGRRRSLPRIPVYNPDQSPAAATTPGNYDPSEEQSEVFSNSEFSPISPWQVGGNGSGQFRQQEHSHFNFDQPAQPPVIMDQFDEFLYKSKHIGSSNGMLNSQQVGCRVHITEKVNNHLEES